VGDFEARTPVRVESTLKYHPEYDLALTLTLESGQRTVSVGQFDWGGLLLKSNGGVQRYTQPGWQSGVERKGRSVLNCEIHQSNRYESRS
jgi:hypothetical protein